jgi:putative ABC transport system permease protein
MFRQIFKNIIRSFLKDKVFSAINLSNLVVGFTAFILLSIVVYHELNWDKYQENYDRIYRVQTRQEDSQPTNYCTYGPAAVRFRLMEDVPEVEKTLLMRELKDQFLSTDGEKQLFCDLGYWAENTAFDIFTYKFIEGSQQNALAEPNTIVLSKRIADNLFHGQNALGKMVVMGKQTALKVDGVYEDLPRSSSLRPEYMVSLQTYETLSGRANFRNDWTYIDNDNIVLLRKGASPRDVDQKIKDAFKDVKNYEKSYPYLHPLSKWHISPNSQNDFIIGMSVLSLAAFLILLLSCVNFINLTMANSTRRSLEIGIKKVVGFSKRAIAAQYIAETVAITMAAAIFGLALAHITTPLLEKILRRDMEVNLFSDFKLPLFILFAGLASGILSGIYPACVISSYNPAKVLKGKLFNPVTKKVSLKKVLVVAQFSISLFMLLSSLIFFNHVNFMLHKNLGFGQENLVFAKINPRHSFSFSDLKSRLANHPEIMDISFSNTIPFKGNIGGYVSWEGGTPEQKEMISRNYVSYDFIPTYKMEIVSGRNFSRDFPADSKSVIINQTAARAFGWDEPIGKNINLYGQNYPVIGVVKDFHPFTVHMPIPVYVMFLRSDTLAESAIVSARFTGDEKTAKQILQSEIEKVIPDDPFEFQDIQLNIQSDVGINF